MSTTPIKIVISGAGLVTPLGLSMDATWEAVRAGKCGLGRLSAMEQELPPESTGGQAPDLPGDFEPGQPREVRYLRHAISEALRNARIDPAKSYPPSRCGFMLGTTLHGMRAAGQFLRSENHAFLSDFLAGATLRNATADLPFTGFSATGCSACSSSLGSIALAVSMLRGGHLDLIVAGGYDTISEYVYGGFNSLRLVAPGPLRPFTRDRKGMKLAEGYGIVVLERADDAARRSVRPLATILGYGESADAHHLTQPHPQGEGAARAMNAALASAGMGPGEIDLIAAHATGTPDNDAGEFAALSRVFGNELPRVPVVAFKSHLGHTLGGAGAVELILSALSLRDQIVPACANIRDDEIEFPGLRVATGSSKPAPLRATLNTSLGFGGANTCMVLGPAPNFPRGTGGPPASSFTEPENHGRAARATSDERGALAPASASVQTSASRFTFHVSHSTSPVFITGVGVVLPNMIGNDAFARALLAPEPRRVTQCAGPIAETEFAELLNARRVRRMSDYVKLSLAATMLACRDAGIDDIPAFSANCSALLGSMHGSANYSESYYRQIIREGILGANPMLFAEGVPNAAAAHLSLMLSLKGPCQTVIGTRTAGLDALHLASLRIAAGEWDRAVVGAAEEHSDLVNATYRHWGLHTESAPAAPFSNAPGGFVAGCGAVTFVLESQRSIEQRRATARGRILTSTGPVPLSHHSSRRGRDVIRSLGDLQHIISSANGTWLDRLEAIAIGRRTGKVVSSLTGHIAETYSVMPLAAIASVLLTGRIPQLFVANREIFAAKARRREEIFEDRTLPPSTIDRATPFAVLCSDYTGLLSAAAIELGARF